jgi:Xaa-Pro aminopeptidase
LRSRSSGSVDVNQKPSSRLYVIRPGRTREADLAAEIDYRMRKLGADHRLETIVATGERMALPHAQLTHRILAKMNWPDMGATLEGYASDMTRCCF